MPEAHRAISQEEFNTLVEKARQPKKGKIVVDTPADDTKLVEGLLGLPAGTFGKSFITIRGDSTACPSCGRETSFLDIVNDGAAFHGNDFVKDVVQGKRGLVYNPNPPRPHKCYNCGKLSPVEASMYGCYTGYFCNNPEDE